MKAGFCWGGYRARWEWDTVNIFWRKLQLASLLLNFIYFSHFTRATHVSQSNNQSDGQPVRQSVSQPTNQVASQSIRPDSIDLLFLGSFPDPFERVERDQNKRKNRQSFAWKYNDLREKIYLKKTIQFPISWTYRRIQETINQLSRALLIWHKY